MEVSKGSSRLGAPGHRERKIGANVEVGQATLSAKRTPSNKSVFSPNGTSIDHEEPVPLPPRGLPYAKLVALFALMFANSVSITAPFPFLPFMVRDFGYSTAEVGAQVGFVASGRFLGNLLTGWIWGLAADKYGRRPTLLLSIGSQIFCSLLFAWTTGVGLYAAAGARLLGGMMNGCVPICKTYVSEVTHPDDQGRALAITMSSWQLGLMVGPVLGGFLANANQKYPLLDTPLIQRYPYALPMVIIAGLCAVSVTIGVYLIDETPVSAARIRRARKRALASKSSSAELDAVATEALISRIKGIAESQRTGKAIGQPSGLAILKGHKPFWATVLYAIISFGSIGYDEVFSVWASTPISMGGLKWTTDRIGVSMTLFGGSTLTGMMVVYPAWERMLGAYRVFTSATIITTLCGVILPFSALFTVSNPDLVMPMVIGVGVFRAVANTAMFVTASMFQNNAVDASIRGSYNGLSFTCVAAVRSLSPWLCGQIYSWSISETRPWPLNAHLVFLFIGSVWLGAGLTNMMSLDKSIERPA